jgi:endo-1,4-beta-xylanase
MHSGARSLGASVITRRSLIQSAAAAGAWLPQAGAASPPAGLAQHARARGILFGCATANYELDDTGFAAALRQEAAILVPEYEMKRNKLEAERGSLDFSAVDSLLRFCADNGMRIRGHPLVWHAANPPWLEDAVLSSRDERLLTAYIRSVVSHFRGQLHSIDVVNEALLADSARRDGLRETFWLKALGPSYIDTAYRAAHEADPSLTLVYNDWGCEMAGIANDRMRAITLDFLEGALARKVPIHAYGMQGHIAAFGQTVDQRKLRDFLASLEAMKLRVFITEHEVYDTTESADIALVDRAAADASARFLDVALDFADTVLTWGLSDRFLDAPSWRQKLAGYAPRTLPLDRDMQRKPMWAAMARAFARAGGSLRASQF